MTTALNPPPTHAPDMYTSRFFTRLLRDLQLMFERLRGVDVAPLRILSGAGTPEGNVTGGVGWLYLRTDGGASTTLYVKESGTGNTGWSAK